MAHLLDQREQRAAERHQVAQHLPAQQRHRSLEEALRGDVGVGDPAVGVDDDDGKRQRVEHRVGGAERQAVGDAECGCRSCGGPRKRRRRRPRANRARATCAGSSLVSTSPRQRLSVSSGDAGA